MAPRPTGTLDTEVRADGTLAFRLRFRAYGERQAVFLHERRDCECGCGGGWTERTARVELREIVARVEAGVWQKPPRREAVRSVAPAEIPLFDDYIEYWLTGIFNGVLGESHSMRTLAATTAGGQGISSGSSASTASMKSTATCALSSRHTSCVRRRSCASGCRAIGSVNPATSPRAARKRHRHRNQKPVFPGEASGCGIPT
jgi:hypothetical protein